MTESSITAEEFATMPVFIARLGWQSDQNDSERVKDENNLLPEWFLK